MIRNILKNGQQKDDMTGHIVKYQKDTMRIYNLLEIMLTEQETVRKKTT